MKGKSVLEVFAVFIGIRAIFIPLLTGNPIIQWELTNLGWTYIGASIGVLFVILILLLTRRDLKSYGLTLSKWRTALDLGLSCYLILLIPYATMLLLLMAFGVTLSQPIGSISIAAADIVAIVLMLRLREKANVHTSMNLMLMASLLILPIILSSWLGRFSILIVSTEVWQLLLSGLGEEVIYRGYYQSRINEELGKPWRISGVEFGPGLLIASTLFSLAHVLNAFKPLQGIYALDWSWGFETFFSGLFFGLLREKTGSILTPAIAHGLPDAVGEALNIVLNLGVVTKG